ncbi:hypothetical protein QFZ25_003424 [Bacillus atrophaeus]|nr:hypothetical protein [Bacillus atrophaeus]
MKQIPLHNDQMQRTFQHYEKNSKPYQIKKDSTFYISFANAVRPVYVIWLKTCKCRNRNYPII